MNSLTLANGWIDIQLKGVYESDGDAQIDLEFKFARLLLGGRQVRNTALAILHDLSFVDLEYADFGRTIPLITFAL